MRVFKHLKHKKKYVMMRKVVAVLMMIFMLSSMIPAAAFGMNESAGSGSVYGTSVSVSSSSQSSRSASAEPAMPENEPSNEDYDTSAGSDISASDYSTSSSTSEETDVVLPEVQPQVIAPEVVDGSDDEISDDNVEIGNEIADEEDGDEEIPDEEEESGEKPDDEELEHNSDALTYTDSLVKNDGEKLTVVVTAEAGTFPVGTLMRLSEVNDTVLDQIRESAEEQLENVSHVSALDISFGAAADENDGWQEVEPLKPVRVVVIPEVQPESADVHVFHVEDSGDVTAVDMQDVEEEDIDALAEADVEMVDTSAEENAVVFETDAFSVYAIVYTVDFHWEVNGKKYEFSMPGGGFVSFTKLMEVLGVAETASGKSEEEEETDREPSSEAADQDSLDILNLNDIEVSEKTKKFVEDVESVVFSDPELVWVGKIEDDSTVHEIREANQLDAEYSASLTQEQIDEINQTTVSAGDWAILSLKSFDTEETLTIVLNDGSTLVIKVTDAKDAMTDDNGQVLSIPNPSGTTITLFDYWIDRENEKARRGWPGYSRNGTTGTESEFWNYWTNNKHDGTNTGINQNHRLKFVPGSDDTADDYLVSDGSHPGYTKNGRVDGINSWNGSYNDYTHSNTYNGKPTQGIVAGALYNSNGQLDATGYPRLNLNNGNGNASNRESLDYLFNPGTPHSGKRSYGEVNKLFYVDPDGYYTYESMDYKAKLQSDKTFKLSEQPNSATTEGQIGFWPFDDLNYWLGMHMHVDFSVPQNGEVLNPRGDYMPMQFEFAGDDDAWVYIDGILVADGGGIHNRTEIDLNFKTGHSQVRGGEYTNILQPYEPVVTDRTLYEIFTDAHNRGLISNEKWASDYTNTADKTVWIDSDGNGTLDTFAPGTKHTFDFFYLERGGGESNLYIHYNLISTTDFSAHKSYHRKDDTTTSDVDESRLRRDQFRFQLIGYDNPEYASEGAEFVKAIMPDAITWDPSKEPGTFDNPLWQTVPASETTEGYRSLTIGNTEDGNVNFGNKEISPSYAGKQYKYVVREVVPDNAVNADGVRWADAPEELRREGGFAYNGVIYDAKIYYFIGMVQETSPGSGQYELKKYRYLDPEYTRPDTETKFFSFVNGTETPVSLKVIKKNDTDVLLDGAEFSLTRAMQNTDEKWVAREWTINNATYHSQSVTGTTSEGTFTFNNLMEGHYILEELQAPAGYKMGDQHRWLLTIEKQDSNKEILLVPYITPLDAEGNMVGNRVPLDPPDNENVIEYEVLNGPLPPIDLSLEKKWYDNGDTSVPEGAEATFELHRTQTAPPVTVELLDKNGVKLDEISVSVGDTIEIQDTFKHHIQTPGAMPVWSGDNVRTVTDNITPNDSGWTISTSNTYNAWFGNGWHVDLQSSTSSSNGQYTVKQEDVTAGVVQLRLDRTYIGATYDYFEVSPELYISNSASGSTTEDEVISTFTLKAQNGDGDAGNPWKKSFNDLPLVDENGHPYSYYFVEVSHLPDNFNQPPDVDGNMGSAASPLTGSGDVIVTNKAPDLPKITASKTWLDENGNLIDAESGLDGLEVKLTLYKGDTEAPASEVRTGEVTRTVTGNGIATWMLLDEHADVSQYTVKETAVKIPGGDFITVDPLSVPSNNAFGGVVTGDSTNGFTITNQLPTTEIGVTKQWKDGTSINADKVFAEAKTISFTLYQKLGSNDGAPYTRESQAVTGTVTYTPSGSGTEASWSTETISNLPKYEYLDGSWHEATYYPVESEINGVTITYQKNGGNATVNPEGAAVTSGTVTIINTDIVFPLKVVKVDKTTGTGLSGAKFQLTRKLPGENDFSKFVHESFEADAENDNKKTGPFTVTSTEGIILEGLFPGEYRIEEKAAPEGYIISLQPFTFTVGADGSIRSSDADASLVLPLVKDGDNPCGFQIGNTPAYELPSAGGIGTMLFTFLGTMIMAIAVGMYFMRKRRIVLS